MAHPQLLDPEVAADAIVAFANSQALNFLEAEGGAGVRDLDRVKCPVLIAWPDKDRILPQRRYSKAFSEQLPQAERVTLRDVGHVPMWDDPNLVADTILRFTAQHTSDKPRRDLARFRSVETGDSASPIVP